MPGPAEDAAERLSAARAGSVEALGQILEACRSRCTAASTETPTALRPFACDGRRWVGHTDDRATSPRQRSSPSESLFQNCPRGCALFWAKEHDPENEIAPK
jgi:hypothetical protein